MPIHPAQAAVGASAAGPTASKANAVAVYDYDSKGDGEISLRDGDDLVILIPETDGWIKVRNLVSQGAGLVPASYIKVVEEKSLPPSASMLSMPAGDNLKRGSSISVAPSSRQGSVTTLPTRSTPTPATSASRQVKAIYDFNATDEGELNFKAGDMIDVLDTGGDFSDEAWWEGRVARTGESGQFPTVFTQGWQALQQQQSSVMNSQNASMASLARAATSSHRMSIIDTGAASRRTSAIPARPVSSVPAQPRARAMYVYEATCDGELSMEIGDIVVITNKNTGSDAWWEGEGPQGKGQFPVNYVEEIHDAAPSAPQPPAPSKRLSIVRPAAAHPQAKALYDYIASADDEIGFKAGDIISLTDATDSDWYVGELHGQSGAFPANYVQKL
ncbi:Intersectin 1 (SH3 domain protein) [Thoreauomyces humboldtii]|nr:Intersectin 1 (SH3 domain protein) [Thoreauomyces humboldtii]